MKSVLHKSLVPFAAFLCLLLCAAAARADSMPASPDADTAGKGNAASPIGDMVMIPGPLRSFLRMAGISQKVSPDDVLPLLARNVYLHG